MRSESLFGSQRFIGQTTLDFVNERDSQRRFMLSRQINVPLSVVS